jgi:hypothetical protein
VGQRVESRGEMIPIFLSKCPYESVRTFLANLFLYCGLKLCFKVLPLIVLETLLKAMHHLLIE